MNERQSEETRDFVETAHNRCLTLTPTPTLTLTLTLSLSLTPSLSLSLSLTLTMQVRSLRGVANALNAKTLPSLLEYYEARPELVVPE